VDFGTPAAPAEINAWTTRQTGGRIPTLFDSLDPATVLVAANALYLRADWQRPIAGSPVQDAPFTRADGSRVPAPTMVGTASYDYAAGAGWQAAEIPYAGGELVMRLLVPTGRTDPAALLAPATLTAAARTAPTRVRLSLPRWKAGTGVDLGAVLRKLGVTDLFDVRTADLTGIGPGVFAGRAVHRATITVDEWGTEAAAVSGIQFPVSAPPAPEVTVAADHPFAYQIVHKPTGVPLIVGTVADPTAG
jgi:serine protease inhibitor